jgi:hypothetical protein
VCYKFTFSFIRKRQVAQYQVSGNTPVLKIHFPERDTRDKTIISQQNDWEANLENHNISHTPAPIFTHLAVASFLKNDIGNIHVHML